MSHVCITGDVHAVLTELLELQEFEVEDAKKRLDEFTAKADEAQQQLHDATVALTETTIALAAIQAKDGTS